MEQIIRDAIASGTVRSTRSFSIQTDQGQVNLIEYVLDAKVKFPSGLELSSEGARCMIWQRRVSEDKKPPIFWKIFLHEDPNSFLFQTQAANEAREKLLADIVSHYNIKEVRKSFLS
jgi:hypothetical protein